MSQPITRNARDGAIALALFAPLHALVGLAGAELAPLALASWLGVSFGVLCLCGELGAARPLNRAGLVLFAAAFVARLSMAMTPDPGLFARAQLLFAFAVLGALLFWSVALMHRKRAPRAVGWFGGAIAGSALALSLAAHLLVGSATVWGFSSLYAALSHPTLDMSAAMTTIDAIFVAWSLPVAALLGRGDLRAQ